MLRSTRFKVTAEIVAAMTSSRALEDVLAGVVERTAKALELWECEIYDYHPAQNTVTCLAIWAIEADPGDQEWVGSTASLDHQPTLRRVLTERRMLAMHRDDPNLPADDRERMEAWGEISCLLVPLVFRDEVIGCLELSEKRHTHVFTKRDLQLAATLAALAASAIQSARMYANLETLATTDGLTGVYNHRYFYERLTQEVARAERYSQPLSLLMIDIDDFKAYNDHFGHRAGDAVLRRIGELLKKHTRQYVDLVARYGGEEFAILLPSTGVNGARVAGERLRTTAAAGVTAPEQAAGNEVVPSAPDGKAESNIVTAHAVGERIRAEVESETFGLERDPPIITLSIGVAGLPGFSASVEALVESADLALYEAKRLGKNRVVLAPA